MVACGEMGRLSLMFLSQNSCISFCAWRRTSSEELALPYEVRVNTGVVRRREERETKEKFLAAKERKGGTLARRRELKEIKYYLV